MIVYSMRSPASVGTRRLAEIAVRFDNGKSDSEGEIKENPAGLLDFRIRCVQKEDG